VVVAVEIDCCCGGLLAAVDFSLCVDAVACGSVVVALWLAAAVDGFKTHDGKEQTEKIDQKRTRHALTQAEM